MNRKYHYLRPTSASHIDNSQLADTTHGKVNVIFATGSLLLFTLISPLSFAASKTITLSIPSMNCPSCPYMVKQSLSRVEGVQSAEADLETRTAEVTFDDAKASFDNILSATSAIGYESSVRATGEGS